MEGKLEIHMKSGRCWFSSGLCRRPVGNPCVSR